MWQWWKAMVSGDVPLEVNPSLDVLAAQTSLKEFRYQPSRAIVLDEIQFSRCKLEVLKVINILKPMTYIIERTVVTENYHGVDFRFITDSAAHAFFVKSEFEGHPDLENLISVTLYHCSHPAFPWKEMGIEFSTFSSCNPRTREILMIGKSAPPEIRSVLDDALVRFFPEEGARI